MKATRQEHPRKEAVPEESCFCFDFCSAIVSRSWSSLLSIEASSSGLAVSIVSCQWTTQCIYNGVGIDKNRSRLESEHREAQHKER